MGDKKRKLTENVAEDSIAPEGKKTKKVKKDGMKKDGAVNADGSVLTHNEAKDKMDKPEVKQRWKIERDEKKARKKEEKRKRKEKATNPVLDEEARREKKERKDRKYNNNKRKKASEQNESKPEVVQAGSPKEERQSQEESHQKELPTDEISNEQEESLKKNSRFICFVGNLPYSANTESVTKHFEKNPPAEVRVATKKDDPKKKCRGFAFIEFDNYDRMKTCLKLYHHSTFDDGKYPPRRINVELTAGGGGNKSEHRKAKIQAKNEKLFDERQRDAKSIKKDKKNHDKKTKNVDGNATGANAVGPEGENEDDKYAGVHPSRRPRMW